MFQLKIFGLAVCLYALVNGANGVDKYTDENRPYEFGFTIDGEQHRHEKKDENGIIMGEFGFITADGVYHVTVYATDENGRFKILSMKNIRVKPYPTANVKKGHSLPFPPSENAPVSQGSLMSPSPEQKPKPGTNQQIASPAKSCSHCSLPTTTTKAPKLSDIAVVSQNREIPNTRTVIGSQPILLSQDQPIYQQNNPQLLSSQVTNVEQGAPGLSREQQSSLPDQSLREDNSQYQHPNYQPEKVEGQNYVSQNSMGQNGQQSGYPDNPNQYPETGKVPRFNYSTQENSVSVGGANQYYPQSENNANQYDGQGESKINPNNPKIGSESTDEHHKLQPNVYKAHGQQESSFGTTQSGYDAVSNTNSVNLRNPESTLRNPKQYSDISSKFENEQPQGFQAILSSQVDQPVSNKPTLVAAQMQIVPKDTNIYNKRPGEKEGLPNGLSKDDMNHLLYTFNYSVAFHGHHEEGYSNGAKRGYYFVTGRNGVRTRIDYIADENGFRPTISQEVLDLLSDDVPKPETEKDEKFGLRGYEFKWLYYPADGTKKQ